MPFERPTLSELVTRVRADMRSGLGISGSLLRRAMADVTATVWAGAVHMLHGHLEWLGRQLFATTADPEFVPQKATLYGIYPAAATYATGLVTAGGVDGTAIPTEVKLVRDDGARYTVTVGDTIAAGEATLTVVADDPGADGDMLAGDELTFESPIAGIGATVTIGDDGLTGGNDQQTNEDVRDRLLLRLRQPPQGGATHDYEAWALAVAGVTRAWVYRHEYGLGTVVVRVVNDNGSPTIIPSAGDIAAVQAVLDEERPVTADVTAEAPVALPIDFDIELDPDTAALRTEIEAALADLLYRVAEPGDGAGRGTVRISHVRTTIGVIVGEGDYVLNAPAADIVPDLGELAILGAVTWS